jgi:hypothetical protein
MLDVGVQQSIRCSSSWTNDFRQRQVLGGCPSQEMRRGMQITVVAQDVRGFRYVAQGEERGGDDGERLLASSEASAVLRRR